MKKYENAARQIKQNENNLSWLVILLEFKCLKFLLFLQGHLGCQWRTQSDVNHFLDFLELKNDFYLPALGFVLGVNSMYM